MNYLALVQRTIRECGATGASLTTVVGASGEVQRFVDWCGDAWLEIQTKKDDWEFLRASNILGSGVSFATVSGTTSYQFGTGAGRVGIQASAFTKWVDTTFRLYTTSIGTNDETQLGCIPYDAWRDGYMISASRNVRTRPEVISIGPNKSLCLGPPPSSAYTVTGDYYLAPSTLSADADTPTGLPLQFHLMIVGLAMTKYASYEAAPEVMSRGQSWYGTYMSRLEGLQAPTIRSGGPLA